MPDSTQDPEVEQVLAAIRRLIVEGPPGGRPATAARLAPLVLTPAHRIDATSPLRADPPPAVADGAQMVAEPLALGSAAPQASEPPVPPDDPSGAEPLVLRADPPAADDRDKVRPQILDDAGTASEASATEPSRLKPLVLTPDPTMAEPSPHGEDSQVSGAEAGPHGLKPSVLGADAMLADSPSSADASPPLAGLSNADTHGLPMSGGDVTFDDPSKGMAMPPTEPAMPSGLQPEPSALDATPGPLVLGSPLPAQAGARLPEDTPPGSFAPNQDSLVEAHQGPRLSLADPADGLDATPRGEVAEPLPDLRLPWEDPAAQDPLRDLGSSWEEPAGHGRLDLGPFAASAGPDVVSEIDAPSSRGATDEGAVLAAVLAAGAAPAPDAVPPAEGDLRALVAELVQEEVRREVAGLRDMIREEVRAALHPSGPG